MRHTLEIEVVGTTVWGWCSCGDWSARACASEQHARGEHAGHRRRERMRIAAKTPPGFPAWDDEEDVEEDE